MSKHILIVEDDHLIAEQIAKRLLFQGWTFETIYNGLEVLPTIKRSCSFDQNMPTQSIDCIILDVNLPGLDGFRVLEQIAHFNIPVLMLTALDGEFDKIKGLDLGAEDYMVKPFSPRELVARLKVIFRRQVGGKSGLLNREHLNHEHHASCEYQDASKNMLKVGGLILDIDQLIIKFKGNSYDITPSQAVIMQVLMQNPTKIFSREVLVRKLWQTQEQSASGDIKTRTIDVHIKTLRQKLGKDIIVSKRAVGYGLGVKDGV